MVWPGLYRLVWNSCFLTVLATGVYRFICACFLFNRAGGRGCTALFALASFLTVLAPRLYRFICASFLFNRAGAGTVPLNFRFLSF